MNQTKLNLALLSSLALAGTATAAAPKDTPKNPNIIIILADDLGFGDIACNGSQTTVSTPNTDRLANEGLRLVNTHVTAATSTPSRYSILTGQYPWREPGTGVAPGDAAMIVSPKHQTLPQMLQRAGYTTAAVGKWHLGLGDKRGAQNWNGEITPGLKDIGFDYSYIMAATGDRVPCVYIENSRVANLDLTNPEDSIRVSYFKPFPGEPTGKDNPEMLKLHPSHGHDQALLNGISRIGYMKGGGKALWVDENIADTITTKAVQFIEREAAADKPFFLYFCTNDVHVPRAPHERFVGKTGMGARGDAIAQFDWSVGEILRTLDSLGIADNTLIVLSSDNGPVVDDGYADRAVELLGKHRPWGPYRGGKYSIFEAGTRVPALVRWPGQVKAKSVSEAAVSLHDLFASFASLTGQKLRDGEAPDSYDNLNALLGKDRKGRPFIVENAGTMSITLNGWKYIAPSNGTSYDRNTDIELGNNPEPQLYDLRRDPGERHNVATEYPGRVTTLSALLDEVKTNPERR